MSVPFTVKVSPSTAFVPVREMVTFTSPTSSAALIRPSLFASSVMVTPGAPVADVSTVTFCVVVLSLPATSTALMLRLFDPSANALSIAMLYLPSDPALPVAVCTVPVASV